MAAVLEDSVVFHPVVSQVRAGAPKSKPEPSILRALTGKAKNGQMEQMEPASSCRRRLTCVSELARAAGSRSLSEAVPSRARLSLPGPVAPSSRCRAWERRTSPSWQVGFLYQAAEAPGRERLIQAKSEDRLLSGPSPGSPRDSTPGGPLRSPLFDHWPSMRMQHPGPQGPVPPARVFL